MQKNFRRDVRVRSVIPGLMVRDGPRLTRAIRYVCVAASNFRFVRTAASNFNLTARSHQTKLAAFPPRIELAAFEPLITFVDYRKPRELIDVGILSEADSLK